jgi:uncharacterized membrane protein YidH (DUF202 family)
MRLLLAAVLIIGGLGFLATPYFTYTQRERVVDVGPIKIDADKQKTVNVPQIAAIGAIIVGVGILAFGARSSV